MRLPEPARFYGALTVSLAALTILAHLLGATVLRGVLWGTHAYGFLPPWALPVALAASLSLLVVTWRSRLEGGAPAARRSTIAVAAVWTGIVVLAAALFWWLRIRHVLLGDSGPLSFNLPLGERTHPRQPLSLLLHHHVYEWTRGLFESTGRSLQDVARDTVALDSVIAGAALVPVAWLLARHLIPPERAAPGEARPRDSLAIALAAGLLLTQGYIQLAFGYVENYTWFALAIALYLWAGMSYLAGRASLVMASLALAAGIGFNMSGIVFLPSFAVLGLQGLLRPERRSAVVRDLILSALVFLGLQLSLAALGGFSAREGFRYMWDLVVRGEATDRSAGVLFSWPHLREFISVQLLIGPFAGFFLAPAAAYRLASPPLKDSRLGFLLLAALPAFGAAWIYGDSIQGIPRDWDLFAPFALAFTAAAVYCMASAPLAPGTLRRLLAVGVLVSVFHSGAWIALNTSESRSLERYKSLPASKGRTEMVVGYWYLTHGQRALAREWFERAVTAYPGNNLAHHQLGLYAMDEARYADAIAHFEIAVRVRPDKPNYRLSLVDALVLGGRLEEALPHLEKLAAIEPGRAQHRACAGIVLSGLGREGAARQALERAAALAPGDPRYAKLLARSGDPDAFQRAMAEDWDALVLP